MLLSLDNGNDHRAGTSDLNIEKHTQVRLRMHRIVILRLCDFLFKIIRLVPSQSSHGCGRKHVAVFIFRFEV